MRTTPAMTHLKLFTHLNACQVVVTCVCLHTAALLLQIFLFGSSFFSCILHGTIMNSVLKTHFLCCCLIGLTLSDKKSSAAL